MECRGFPTPRSWGFIPASDLVPSLSLVPIAFPSAENAPSPVILHAGTVRARTQARGLDQESCVPRHCVCRVEHVEGIDH